MMKKHTVLLLVFGVVSVAVISLAEGVPGEKPSANRETQELRNELVELRAKIQILEERTKSLETVVEQSKQRSQPAPLNLLPGNPLSLKPFSDSRGPKIWGEKEVNGWPVYIVPCEQQSH